MAARPDSAHASDGNPRRGEAGVASPPRGAASLPATQLDGALLEVFAAEEGPTGTANVRDTAWPPANFPLDAITSSDRGPVADGVDAESVDGEAADRLGQ